MVPFYKRAAFVNFATCFNYYYLFIFAIRATVIKIKNNGVVFWPGPKTNNLICGFFNPAPVMNKIQ